MKKIIASAALTASFLVPSFVHAQTVSAMSSDQIRELLIQLMGEVVQLEQQLLALNQSNTDSATTTVTVSTTATPTSSIVVNQVGTSTPEATTTSNATTFGAATNAVTASPVVGPRLPKLYGFYNGSVDGTSVTFAWYKDLGDYESGGLSVTIVPGLPQGQFDYANEANYGVLMSECPFGGGSEMCFTVSGLSSSTPDGYGYFFTATKNGMTATSSIVSFSPSVSGE